jgi:hypothetical protein
MKKIFISILSLALAGASVSCNPDGNNDNGGPRDSDITKMTGKIQEMPSGGEYVLKLEDYETDAVLATAPVSADGSFSIELPDNYNSGVLLSGSDLTEDIPEGITISNPGMKIGSASLMLYEGDKRVGFILYGGERQSATEYSEFEGGLVYADSNCDIKGSFVYEGEFGKVNVIYDASIKKGWNWIFGIHEENIEGQISQRVTTEVPAGAAFQYVKEGFENPPAPSARLRNTPFVRLGR